MKPVWVHFGILMDVVEKSREVARNLYATHLESLIPYFKRVLTRLNAGRKTRDAILRYVREQALRDAQCAQSIVGLLEWMCHIHVVADRMYSLETLALVQERHPSLSTSIQL